MMSTSIAMTMADHHGCAGRRNNWPTALKAASTMAVTRAQVAPVRSAPPVTISSSPVTSAHTAQPVRSMRKSPALVATK